MQNVNEYSMKILMPQKLNSRTAALVKSAGIRESDKGKWKESLVMSMMSSEDSDDDSGSFSVRPLPWRSERAAEFFRILDRKDEKRLTQRSKRMKYERRVGAASERPMPKAGSVPGWCLQK